MNLRPFPPCLAAAVALAAPAHAAEGALSFSGYVQPQFLTSELSEDEVTAEGTPRNLDRFSLRSARVLAHWKTKHARVWIEPDLNTVDGPWVSPNNAAAAVFLPAADPARPPLVELSAGIFDVPFGFELVESSAERPFMERTLGSRALFPGDHDVGVQLAGALGPVRYAVAVVNGVPLTNTPDDVYVYTTGKTVTGRLGVDAGAPEVWRLAGGVSLLTGTGFHAGTPATKTDLGWSDENQNGTVTLDELVGINAQAATASETFEQWAVNADVRGGFKTPLGWTRVFAEATMASNLDRGWLVADPVSAGYDLRELAWSAGAIQEVTKWGLVGFRADSYDPNSDYFETRRGDFVPTDVSVLTLSPVVGAQWPGVGRLLVQYDYVVDQLGRDVLGEPRDLPNDQLTVRGQVEF